MLLEFQELEVFFRLHPALMFFVNRRLDIIHRPFATPREFAAAPPADRLKVRNAWLANPELTDAFVADNPAALTPEELGIVRSWRHAVAGKFYILRELKRHAVFLTASGPAIAYGVSALSQPFCELIGPRLPVMTETVLLPFRDRIVYDGLISSYPITFGPGIRRSLNENFKEAKNQHGIVTSLPISANPPTVGKPKASPRPKALPKSETPTDASTVIVGLVEAFCHRHLNGEYADLCRKLAGILAAKRPSPLLRGSPNAWASGIVRAVGGVNFLHDKSQTPHMRTGDIDAGFDVGESAGAAKATAIRKLLDLHPLDAEWTLPSRLIDNPMIWLLKVNGTMMDLRRAPREVQEIAFGKGLIPFIPANRPTKA